MFNDIIKFCSEHWDFILSSIFLLVSLLLAIFKKRPCLNTMDFIFSEVLEKLPVYIDLVEKAGHGEEKLLTVLELVKSYLQKEFKFNDFDTIRSWVIAQIESILSTPQKKEVTVCRIEKENQH